MIRILPRPQHIEEREGRLLLDYHCRITMDSSCPSEVFFYASQLAEQLKNPFAYIGTKNRKYSHPKRKIFQKSFTRNEKNDTA